MRIANQLNVLLIEFRINEGYGQSLKICYFHIVGLYSCLSVLEVRNNEWFLKKVFDPNKPTQLDKTTDTNRIERLNHSNNLNLLEYLLPYELLKVSNILSRLIKSFSSFNLLSGS